MKIETGTKVIVIISIRFSCTLDFLNRVKEEMLFIAPGVPEGVAFTVKQLSREEYYAPLSDWDKTLAGACMVYLVEHGHVPFENVPRTTKNPYPYRYRIKGSYSHH